MKVFLINLAKNKDRLLRAQARLGKLGVEFERIEAVYGKELSAEEKSKAVNRFRWWCAQGRKIRDGEIGCALSHYSIYKRMQDEKTGCACILEDDNLYSDNFPHVLACVEKSIDVSKPQVVLLSNCTSEVRATNDFQLVAAKKDSGAFAYVITAKAARQILKANLPMHVPCDYWRRWVSRGLISLFHAFPTVCVPEDRKLVGSDIETGYIERVSEFGRGKWIIHKIKRLIGVTLDNLVPMQR